MATLTNRLQVLLDDERLERLERASRRTGAPVAELVRRAIDHAYPGGEDERDAAWQRLLAAEPVEVDDWQAMKADLRDGLRPLGLTPQFAVCRPTRRRRAPRSHLVDSAGLGPPPTHSWPR